ncbi:GntR family transcriptional regulator [Leptolyngbya sp. CCY15150]|uniref:GntR family transcriptional regulator n=1 Tax=Leptolyngbya sp. CCY15150 TaxID=2767772 RepID=UPI001EF27D7E|nr:GntR family transcriptional regulator [Leptolyngbya sp. CCY15150]
MTFSMVSTGQEAGQPLHVFISEQLKEKIETGAYEPGERLPSEFDLGEMFGVSRTTIRKAISSLIQQGLVTTQRGKGIFVTDPHKISFSIANPLLYFDVALKQQGYTSRVQSLRFQRIPASADIKRKLDLSDQDAQVYWQEKIYYADDTPIALDITYYPDATGQALSEPLCQGFTYSTLVKHGIHLMAAKVSLESIPATYKLSEYLAVPLGLPLLVLNYVAYQSDSQKNIRSEAVSERCGNRLPAVCGKTLSRSDWTCYTAEIEVDHPDFSSLAELP